MGGPDQGREPSAIEAIAKVADSNDKIASECLSLAIELRDRMIGQPPPSPEGAAGPLEGRGMLGTLAIALRNHGGRLAALREVLLDLDHGTCIGPDQAKAAADQLQPAAPMMEERYTARRR